MVKMKGNIHYKLLYKCMHREHVERLQKKGEFRIGTLYEYRKEEKYGKVIGDKQEGIKESYHDIENEQWTPETQPEFTKELIKVAGTGKPKVTLKNVRLQKIESSQDYYTYCMCEEFNEDAWKKYSYYDTCVSIEKPEAFFRAINEELSDTAYFVAIGRCEYLGRQHRMSQNCRTNPAFLKDKTLAWQQEVRVLWLPKKKHAIEPLIVISKEAAQYCSVHKNFKKHESKD